MMVMGKERPNVLYDVLLGDGGYIYQGISEMDGHVIMPHFVEYPHTLFRRILHVLFVGHFPMNGKVVEWLTGRNGFKWLTTLKEGDRLLFHDIYSLRTLRAVAYLTPTTVKRFLYISNTLIYCYPPQRISKIIEKIKKMGYQIVTFDQKDALNYDIKYAPQFYRFPDRATTTEIKYDFFFCGLNKGRGEIIGNLEKQLSGKGFRCKFIVPQLSGKGKICYNNYLEYIQECRCVVDITQENQAGLTRRPIEALFFNKKLVTNNKEIIEFDFYRKSNIFVLGIDNINDIDHFMKMKLEIIPDDIKRKYDVNTWLENFK